MAHDHHFLSRLDRVTEAQVECALSLYRDEKLVRFILERANTPTNGRIAISLDRDEGPFIVLASDGHFVTCLGRGMFPTGHPVLSKAWLDRAIADWATYRAGLARGAERRAGQEGGLFHAVRRRAHTFSREDFKALRVVAEFVGSAWSAFQYRRNFA
ncbi:hypothetical protein AKJ09_00792 [Labilithrix luteola]|uniref:Uncharacterized protein n=1 Tax=Labilithrix luteola TaxID=1391654 RepID=A0A0K1PKR5_9BACT|nr:hypothetical protein [Labilithrix luteola]AKU94128.1 hypothetical protein AKJ09_00792 [Labilithrix luteola]